MRIDKTYILEHGISAAMLEIERMLLLLCLDKNKSIRKNASIIKMNRSMLRRKVKTYGLKCKPRRRKCLKSEN